MFDAHMHTPLCRHATGTPLEYARAAVRAGLDGVCFTDHSPMPPWYDADVRMRRDELPRYLEMVEEAREAFAGQLEVRVGLEADFHPGTERYVAELLDAHPWDYVIGSVHYLGAWGFDDPAFVAEYDRRDLDELYDEYFRLVSLAAASGLFDSIGHLDLPKKFGHRPSGGYLNLACQALDVIAEAGLSLDVNTAGWRKPAAELYPAEPVLREAFARGIGVVLGSDAHAPEEVGSRFADARDALGRAGYERALFYRGREPFAAPL